MDTKTLITHYLPYWIMGLMMAFFTLRSEDKDLMRIQPKSLLKFAKTMFLITLFRCIMMYFNPPTMQSVAPVLQIPLWLTITVGWEDMVHVLPLAIIARYIGDSKLAKVIMMLLTAMVMFSFFIGHLYQNIFSAFIISLSIPIVTKLGKKHGFGTTAICHMGYDFITLLTIRLFLGL